MTSSLPAAACHYNPCLALPTGLACRARCHRCKPVRIIVPPRSGRGPCPRRRRGPCWRRWPRSARARASRRRSFPNAAAPAAPAPANAREQAAAALDERGAPRFAGRAAGAAIAGGPRLAVGRAQRRCRARAARHHRHIDAGPGHRAAHHRGRHRARQRPGAACLAADQRDPGARGHADRAAVLRQPHAHRARGRASGRRRARRDGRRKARPRTLPTAPGCAPSCWRCCARRARAASSSSPKRARIRPSAAGSNSAPSAGTSGGASLSGRSRGRALARALSGSSSHRVAGDGPARPAAARHAAAQGRAAPAHHRPGLALRGGDPGRLRLRLAAAAGGFAAVGPGLRHRRADGGRGAAPGARRGQRLHRRAADAPGSRYRRLGRAQRADAGAEFPELRPRRRLPA